jgi:hypothetical protein
MVVFLDLEDDAEPPEQMRAREHWSMQHGTAGVLRRLSIRGERGVDAPAHERENPNKEKAITKALGCYPIISSIASHIDLNSLDALSLSCRQVRANLLQFRTQLITSTLHCENEDVELDPEHTFRYRARAADWYFVEAGRDAHGSGKVGDCARDMVGGCRRCGMVVCRVCFGLNKMALKSLTQRDRTALSNLQRLFYYAIDTVVSVRLALELRFLR